MHKLLSMTLLLTIPGSAMAQDEAFPSTYTAPIAEPTLLQNATVLTGDGRRLENTSVLLANGVIAWVGEGEVPPETTIVDASERWVTPGLIDVHSHLGVYPSPGVAAHSDGNEAVASVAYRLSEVIAIYPITPASPMGVSSPWGRSRANSITWACSAASTTISASHVFAPATPSTARPRSSWNARSFASVSVEKCSSSLHS